MHLLSSTGDRRREKSEEADEYANSVDDDGVEKWTRPPVLLHAVKNAGQLQADEDEDNTVEQISDHFPDRLRLETNAGIQDVGRFPTEVESRRDHGEDAGDMQELIGQKIADVGVNKETVKNICGPSSTTRRRTQAMHLATTSPTAMPPTDT